MSSATTPGLLLHFGFAHPWSRIAADAGHERCESVLFARPDYHRHFSVILSRHESAIIRRVINGAKRTTCPGEGRLQLGCHHIRGDAKVLMPPAIERSGWEYFSAKADQRRRAVRTPHRGSATRYRDQRSPEVGSFNLIDLLCTDTTASSVRFANTCMKSARCDWDRPVSAASTM
jgi:hypothetical protein